MKHLLCTLPVLLALTACGDFLKVSQPQYGDKWPFTISEGTLDCTVVALPGVLINKSPKAVVLKSGENTYAINGAAQTHAKKFGYQTLTDIWKDNPAGGKIPVPSELIAKGLEACN